MSFLRHALRLLKRERLRKVSDKNTASPPGEDDFSTTPGGLDLAVQAGHELSFL